MIIQQITTPEVLICPLFTRKSGCTAWLPIWQPVGPTCSGLRIEAHGTFTQAWLLAVSAQPMNMHPTAAY